MQGSNSNSWRRILYAIAVVAANVLVYRWHTSNRTRNEQQTQRNSQINNFKPQTASSVTAVNTSRSLNNDNHNETEGTAEPNESSCSSDILSAIAILAVSAYFYCWFTSNRTNNETHEELPDPERQEIPDQKEAKIKSSYETEPKASLQNQANDQTSQQNSFRAHNETVLINLDENVSHSTKKRMDPWNCVTKSKTEQLQSTATLMNTKNKYEMITENDPSDSPNTESASQTYEKMTEASNSLHSPELKSTPFLSSETSKRDSFSNDTSNISLSSSKSRESRTQFKNETEVLCKLPSKIEPLKQSVSNIIKVTSQASASVSDNCGPVSNELISSNASKPLSDAADNQMRNSEVENVTSSVVTGSKQKDSEQPNKLTIIHSKNPLQTNEFNYFPVTNSKSVKRNIDSCTAKPTTATAITGNTPDASELINLPLSTSQTSLSSSLSKESCAVIPLPPTKLVSKEPITPINEPLLDSRLYKELGTDEQRVQRNRTNSLSEREGKPTSNNSKVDVKQMLITCKALLRTIHYHLKYVTNIHKILSYNTEPINERINQILILLEEKRFRFGICTEMLQELQKCIQRMEKSSKNVNRLKALQNAQQTMNSYESIIQSIVDSTQSQTLVSLGFILNNLEIAVDYLKAVEFIVKSESDNLRK